MGLPDGWVTESPHDLTMNQQLTALGNGVLPAQARAALQRLICAHDVR
ncbi:DNA-cytosine methyltransferase [Leucobacter sp. 7(1)]|nr:DNA-cytosine methyltransferase [Leucobacter sp. 7(1)]